LAHFALDLNCGLSVVSTKLMMSIPMGLKIECYAQSIDTAGETLDRCQTPEVVAPAKGMRLTTSKHCTFHNVPSSTAVVHG
jgi:hypothetical protein